MAKKTMDSIMQFLERNDCSKCIHKVEGVQHPDIIWCSKIKMPLYQLELKKCIHHKLKV